jgi:membrane protein DedA with SNARE-associated domain
VDTTLAYAADLTGALADLTGILQRYGYVAIVVLVLVESFGVPAPGQTAIIIGAALAGRGHLNIVVVAVAAFLAAVIGDSIGFGIGLTGGHRLIVRFGKYVHITPERLARAERFMSRHGAKVITIARFIDGLRQINGILAGAAEFPWRRFLLFNAIGAAAWVGVWATAGYVASDHLTKVEHLLGKYEWYALVAVVALILGYIAWRMVRRRRAKPAGQPDPD